MYLISTPTSILLTWNTVYMQLIFSPHFFHPSSYANMSFIQSWIYPGKVLFKEIWILPALNSHADNKMAFRGAKNFLYKVYILNSMKIVRIHWLSKIVTVNLLGSIKSLLKSLIPWVTFFYWSLPVYMVYLYFHISNDIIWYSTKIKTRLVLIFHLFHSTTSKFVSISNWGFHDRFRLVRFKNSEKSIQYEKNKYKCVNVSYS